MWERMWKPSQSGNPAGVGKAYLEAMREGSTQTQASPSTEHARRWRWRKQLGRIVITFNVSPHLTDKLVRLGWLDAAERAGKEADRSPVGRGGFECLARAQALVTIVTAPFRQARGTRQARSGELPTQPTRSRSPPTQNGCGPCLQRSRPPNAQGPFWCQDGAPRLQVRAGIPAAMSGGPQDSTPRSPAARWFARQGDPPGRPARDPRRSRPGLPSLRSARVACVQRPGAPRHRPDPPRDAPPRRRRAGHWAHQGRAPDEPQLPQRARRRPHQRRARRRRVQLRSAPALARAAFACLDANAACSPNVSPKRLKNAPRWFFTDDSLVKQLKMRR